jgi:hypothetical protein
MVTKLDEYVRHLHVDESSKDEATECSHEPHYSQSCSYKAIVRHSSEAIVNFEPKCNC